MKRTIHSMALAALVLMLLPMPARAARLLIPAGNLVGLRLKDDTVTVAAFDETYGGPAREAGLQIGDEILKIGDSPVTSPGDIRRLLTEAPSPVAVTVTRQGSPHLLHITPTETDRGKRLGVYLRQGITGIGTVTWYDPDTGRFGTLGHGVSTREGALAPMTEGQIFDAELLSVVPGRVGHPGQLKGGADGDDPRGTLLRNTHQGVFGVTRRGWTGEPLPAAAFTELHTGPAAIRSTVTPGPPMEYSVEILKIYPPDRTDSRNLLLRITDPRLLSHTGGIVQGMSGSPIIQDGRLVGAVTHVMVSDPTLGYGIFIGNMLDAAA